MSPRTLRLLSRPALLLSETPKRVAALPTFAKRATSLSVICILLSGCVAPKYTAAEKELSETLTGSKFQPATREFRDNIETQDVLAQAAFWSREHNLNPGDLEAAIKLASAVRRMGNPSQAIEITQQTRALYPRDPYLAAEYAAALIASERGVDAIDTLDSALRNASGYARLWSLKGAALDQMEQYELARKHYARALQITPYDPSILANVGLSYALSGDAKTAENWLRRAVAIPGAGPSVRQNLAIVLQLQGKDREANNLLPKQRAAELTPPPARPQSNIYGSTQKPRQPQTYQPQGGQPRNSQIQNRRPQNYGPQGYNSQSYTPKTPTPASAAPASNRTPRVYGGSTPQSQAYARPSSNAPQNYAPRSNRPQNTATYNAQKQSGMPYYGPAPQGSRPVMSASDAARAAARDIQNRKMGGRYVEPVSGPTAEQQSILERLSQSVGPRPSGGNGYAGQAQSSQGQWGQPQAQQYQRAPQYAQPNPDEDQYQPLQTEYPQGQYSQPQYQNAPTPTPRGAARRR